MKTVNTIYNPKKKAGEQSYSGTFCDGKVRKRREWRGIKDTLMITAAGSTSGAS